MPNPLPGTVFIPVEQVMSSLGKGNQIAQAIQLGLVWGARGFIAPCEILLRHEFGERYFSIPITIACVATLELATFGQFLAPGTVSLLVLIYLGGRGSNQYACFRRDRKGEYWHSYSEGVSRLRLRFVDRYLAGRNFTFDFSKLVIEPAVLIGLGIGFSFLLARVDAHVHPFGLSSLAQYLILAGIASIGYQYYCWGERRRMILDEKDAYVLADIRRLASSERTNRQTIRHCGGVAYATASRNQAWRR